MKNALLILRNGMHLIIALSRTDDVKSVGLLRLQHLFYFIFFTPYWANQHVSISPSLHPIRITAQSSPEQNSLRHIPETSTLPKASHTKMKPQSGSTGLSQLFCTSVVRASLSLFFFNYYYLFRSYDGMAVVTEIPQKQKHFHQSSQKG